MMRPDGWVVLFFFNDTATTEIYTLSLHDGSSDLPGTGAAELGPCGGGGLAREGEGAGEGDRKSTRLNSRHLVISYAGFWLKKKKNHQEGGQRECNFRCGHAGHLTTSPS